SFCSHPNSAKRPASFLMFTCRASAVSSCRADWRPHMVERLSSLLPLFRILESRSGRSRAGPSAFSRSLSTERPSFNVSIAPSTGPTVERISRGRSGEPSGALNCVQSCKVAERYEAIIGCELKEHSVRHILHLQHELMSGLLNLQ